MGKEMKKMIALVMCLMLCLAAVPVYAGETGETAEFPAGC